MAAPSDVGKVVPNAAANESALVDFITQMVRLGDHPEHL
jgi:hypothetical protein